MPQTPQPHTTSTRPLLIVDADEVLLHFVEALSNFLPERGLYARWDSFALNGNILDAETHAPIKEDAITLLIDDFFANATHTIQAVEGAADTLNTLSRTWDIHILSNIPAAYRDARLANLAQHGIRFPLLTNCGGKGPTVQRMASTTSAPTAFVDDLPPQHTSVREHAPSVYRIHHVANKKLRPLLPKAEAAHIRLDDWLEIEHYLNALL